jgi:hypothetical protein
MRVDHYDNLVGKVGRELPARRYLFLVIVPREVGSYCVATEECLTLSHAAYCASLMDETPASQLPNTSKVTVSVPKKNLLTVEALTNLIRVDDTKEAQ